GKWAVGTAAMGQVLLPMRPSGRHTSTSAISRYTPMPDSSAKKTLPNVSTKPTSSEATSAPVMEPMPPITTTTKQMMSTLDPMPGYTDDIGAAIMPASAASATPPAKTMRYSRWMSMPRL